MSWLTAPIKIYGLLILSALLAASLTTQAYQRSKLEDKLKDIEVERSVEREASARAFAQAITEAREKEQSLQTEANEQKAKLNEQVAIHQSRTDSLLDRVRRAEAARSNPIGLSCTASAPSTRETRPIPDSTEFLGSLGSKDVLEAQRADTIREHLLACYAQYDRVKDALSR